MLFCKCFLQEFNTTQILTFQSNYCLIKTSFFIGSGMLVLSLRILVFSFCMLWPIWVEVALSKKVLYCICCWLWERSTSSSSCIHIVHWIKFLLWAVVSLWIMTNFIHGSYCYMQQQQFKPNPSKIETILKMEPPRLYLVQCFAH